MPWHVTQRVVLVVLSLVLWCLHLPLLGQCFCLQNHPAVRHHRVSVNQEQQHYPTWNHQIRVFHGHASFRRMMRSKFGAVVLLWAATKEENTVVGLPDTDSTVSSLQHVRDVWNSLWQASTAMMGTHNSASETVQAILDVCDQWDARMLLLSTTSNSSSSSTSRDSSRENFKRYYEQSLGDWSDALRLSALEFQRYHLLVRLMRMDYTSYVATASWLSPSRIPRWALPNVQDVPYNSDNKNIVVESPAATSTVLDTVTEEVVVADCTLDSVQYQESLLDQVLLSVFRKLVTHHTGGVTSEKPGILGLLEQGRTFMLVPNQTPEAQHAMVQNTLGGLMTPVLPPFYRIFMSGIVPPQLNTVVPTAWRGRQVGPWFYAPWLTSMVTPTFFGFLVGPSRPNRRSDGHRGGLVVEKCKFLQESGCKGLCLHQCKLPAQQFFAETLGLPLTVTPNFVTQECQWSFGQVPVPIEKDTTFPTGCLAGCESRKAVRTMAQQQTTGSTVFVNLCN